MVFAVIVFIISVTTFFCVSVSADGPAKTYIECFEKPEEQRSTKIGCSVNGKIASGMRLFRPRSGHPEEILTCNFKHSECRLIPGIEGYKLVIDKPSHISLTIKSFNSSFDYGEWMCTDGVPPGSGRTKCRKQFEI